MIELIKPNVERYNSEPKDYIGINYNHIAKCARICYKSQKIGTLEENEIFVNSLIRNDHISMLRHDNRYFEIPINVNVKGKNQIINSPFVTCVKLDYTYCCSTNSQYVIEHEDIFKYLRKYEVTEVYALENFPTETHRFCFKIITQISTSRELNRVSPNNISEQSTRYCNYSKDKFGGDLKLCIPHWIKIKEEFINKRLYLDEYLDRLYISCDNESIKLIDVIDGCNNNIFIYLNSFYSSNKSYKQLINSGVLPQDARGIIPLDTATEVVYTYSIKEWKKIIENRYLGKRGTPHPNAKIVIGEVYKQLISNHHYLKFS